MLLFFTRRRAVALAWCNDGSSQRWAGYTLIEGGCIAVFVVFASEDEFD